MRPASTSAKASSVRWCRSSSCSTQAPIARSTIHPCERPERSANASSFCISDSGTRTVNSFVFICSPLSAKCILQRRGAGAESLGGLRDHAAEVEETVQHALIDDQLIGHAGLVQELGERAAVVQHGIEGRGRDEGGRQAAEIGGETVEADIGQVGGRADEIVTVAVELGLGQPVEIIAAGTRGG